MSFRTPQPRSCERCGKIVKNHTIEQCLKHLHRQIRELRVQMREVSHIAARVQGHGPIDPVTCEPVF